jgi:hypothetical protein
MIRLTWLQFRAQAVTAATALAAFAVLLAATGPHMASLYAASGLSGCHGGSCQNLAGGFEAQMQSTGAYESNGRSSPPTRGTADPCNYEIASHERLRFAGLAAREAPGSSSRHA